MKNDITEMLGIDVPIFAFSHCRDVVAAVSRAGGLGVLGAVAHSPEQLEIDLAWIEAEIGDKPYGAATHGARACRRQPVQRPRFHRACRLFAVGMQQTRAAPAPQLRAHA